MQREVIKYQCQLKANNQNKQSNLVKLLTDYKPDIAAAYFNAPLRMTPESWLLRKITESGSVNKTVFTFSGSVLKQT